MSTRPASNWPWLDDALVDAGVFVDDPTLLTGGTDGPDSHLDSHLDWWLDAGDLVGSDQAGAAGGSAELLGDSDPLAGRSAASDHDPFHFEPTDRGDTTSGLVDDPIPHIDPITASLIDAIDTAPGFVVVDTTSVDTTSVDTTSVDTTFDDSTFDDTLVSLADPAVDEIWDSLGTSEARDGSIEDSDGDPDLADSPDDPFGL